MRTLRSLAGWLSQNGIFVWVTTLIAVNQLGFGAIVPAVPLYARTFDVPQSAIGLTIAIYGLARFLLGVPTGGLADRLGRRGTIVLGCLLTAAGNLLCAVVPTYLPFLVARFIAGAGASLVGVGCQIVLADISPPERRGRIMSTYQGIFVFAVGLGPFPGGLLIEHFGLAAPFWAFAALSLLAGALGWTRLPETRGLRPAVRSTGGPAALPFGQQLAGLVRQPGFLLVSLVAFASYFGRTGGLFNLVPLLGKERLELPADQIGLGLGLISITGLALAYPSGALVDRFGRKAVIVPATLLTGLSFACFPLAPSFAGFMAGCLVWGIASGITGAAPGAYAADMAPPGMNAAAVSAHRTLADLGYIAGPLLLGAVADLAGMDAALYGTTGLLLVSALLFALFAPETLGRPVGAERR